MAQRIFFQTTTKLERGAALITALLLLTLMSALSVALLYRVNSEQNLQRTDSANNIAFYGAEAGMEKMVADLTSLYNFQAAPGCSDIAALTANYPSQSDVGVTYSQYQITLPNGSLLNTCAGAAPPWDYRTISQGPNAGLQAQIVPLRMAVTAARPSGETVSMVRQVEVARIPIFQFGVFSETDLSFFPGPDFDFNGRIHTNGNLFLAEGPNQRLWFHTYIRAAKDVIRNQLANGEDTNGQGRTGKVLIPNNTGGCDSKPTSQTSDCLDLQYNEGSTLGGISTTYGGTAAENTGWPLTSTGPRPNYYNHWILSGKTGARQLEMAFVVGDTDPIEIIRRPRNGENPTSSVAESRLYNQAQIRVLLSDDPAELPGGANDGQNIRLANYTNPGVGAPDYQNGVSVDGAATKTFFAEGKTSVLTDGDTGATRPPDSNWVSPTLSASNLLAKHNPENTPPLRGVAGPDWNLLDGYLRVEYRDSNANYVAVTKEWLELGFARGFNPPTRASQNSVNPKAILILQQKADRNFDGIENGGQAAQTNHSSLQHTSSSCKSTDPTSVPANCSLTTRTGSGCTSGKYKVWNYDCVTDVAAVAGELMTDAGSTITGPQTRNNWYPINMYDTREGEFRDTSSTTCKVNGVLNLVEIDVGNLRRWLKGTIGANGTRVEYLTQNGYILYFSDRRGMQLNTRLAPPAKNGEYGYEDVINQSSATGTPNNVLDEGEDVNGNGGAPDKWGAADLGLGFGGAVGNPTATPDCLTTARANWVSGARHGVRLVNGSLGKVPTRGDNDLGGFTLASENPAYILGDYNANGSFGDTTHASTAVIADTVTLLSNGFSDITMFSNPANAGNRPASDTWYRVAIATGKNKNFRRAAFASMSGVPNDFGTDGGVHNFLRYLEDWGGRNINYKGSMASMYYSMYATGVFKCCATVYGAPTRNYSFDTDFEDITKMPPGTPTVRDVVNLGFQQVF